MVFHSEVKQRGATYTVRGPGKPQFWVSAGEAGLVPEKLLGKDYRPPRGGGVGPFAGTGSLGISRLQL